jgi:hypothetical protein
MTRKSKKAVIVAASNEVIGRSATALRVNRDITDISLKR